MKANKKYYNLCEPFYRNQ